MVPSIVDLSVCARALRLDINAQLSRPTRCLPTLCTCHVQLRLNSEQRQQKEAAEATIADLQDQETLETDPDAKLELQKQIVDGKAGLDELMEAFAVSA